MQARWHIGTIVITIGCWGWLAVHAQDWPQWRGPRRDGSVSGFAAPAIWPKELKRVWRVPVGAGYSSPVAAAGRIFLHAREGDAEIVTAHDWRTGRTLWRDRYDAPSGKKREYALSEGEGPYSTPLVVDGRLYTLGINATLSCYDAATGRLHWRRDYAGELKSKKRFCGTAMSPLGDGELLFIYVGDDDHGRLIAHDRRNGQERWSWADAGAAYASPIMTELDGTRQLIVPTDQTVAGLVPATGKILWTTPLPGKSGGCSLNIPMPLVSGGLVILSHDQGTRAIRPVRAGDGWKVDLVWEKPQFTMGINTAALDGDSVYGLNAQRKGQYFQLDARTGEIRWASEGRAGDLAATFVAGEFLFFLSGEGMLTVADKQATGFTSIAEYPVAGSKTWAQPVLWRNELLVRGAVDLTLWRLD